MSRVGGRSYGQRVPPLTSVIRSILERYPDGGQILKEIIQNADDASATKVSFLLDSRASPYGTSSLLNPDLAKFQGPALYSFNDALFKKEDWDGLESLMDSKKKEEPLKVGRFGIGFNSIYHVTDLPSVVSGNCLAFLDPHEMYFGKNETGRQFDLQEPLLDFYHDQFSPFEEVLDYRISQRFVNGTLFRFPLRNEASKLSQKPYSTDNVRSLFHSLKEEASLILLFLKNIEEICIYETDEFVTEKLVFRVVLKDCCRSEVRNERQGLLRQVSEWERGAQAVLNLTLEMIVEIYDHGDGTREERWITHNQIGDAGSKLREKALELHLLPWVGVAAPLSVERGRSIGSNGGRIFCFLPLPPDADSKTGYPVHFHGYFGLTDNRRGLKWPGLECQNDNMAEWNVRLMKYIGAEAYANLILAMTSRMPFYSKEMISVFYQCWPNREHVSKHWDTIVDAVFNKLSSKRVFWTWSNGGKWLTLDQAVLERIRNYSKDTRNVIVSALHNSQEPVVSLPLHVDQSISHVRNVTPMYVRSVMKRNRLGAIVIEQMTKQDKIVMLEYIISDKQFVDLAGINLLPLANGYFTSFKPGAQCNVDNVVYVESPDNRMELLESMQSRFLDPNLKHDVLSCLAQKAVTLNQVYQSPLQLVSLQPSLVIDLLKQVLPKTMFNSSDPVTWTPSKGNHPSEVWLEKLWRWLAKTFPYDLTQLEGYPLIKCSVGQNKALAVLTRNTRIIRQKSRDFSLTLEVVTLLKKAGITVLYEVPSYMSNHSCFSVYVADPSPEGVLKVLQNSGVQRTTAAVSVSDYNSRQSLRALLCSLRRNLSSETKNFIKSLPIYIAIDMKSSIKAVNHNFTAPCGFANSIHVEVKNASSILSAEDPISKMLLHDILAIPPMTLGTFILREILPYLGSYQTKQSSLLMCWVLRCINVLQNEEPNLRSYLTNLNFVDSGQGKLLKPRDLFDPRNRHNKILLEGERARFPVNEFSQEDILVQLRSMGLKDTLDENDVVSLVESLRSLDINAQFRKAIALLEFIDDHRFLLEKVIANKRSNIRLKDYLLNVKWIPCKSTASFKYPKCLPLKSIEKSLYRPSEVVTSQYTDIVGAVMPVMHVQTSPELQHVFGWNKSPDALKVFEQLKIICTEVRVDSLKRNEKDELGRMVKSIYKVLAKKGMDDYYLNLKQAEFPWVWNGQGFSLPGMIAYNRSTNFDLKPYLYIIPDDLQEQQLQQFFLMFGVKDDFTEDDLLDVMCTIKKKHDSEPLSDDVARDRRMTLDILNWIVRDGSLNDNLRGKLYIPIMGDQSVLKLVPLLESTFCDAAWLRGNLLELQSLPELSGLSLIDESISLATAKYLGVPPMSQCVTSPETLQFEQAGPYEPITTRIKNILDEYKEGAGVFKELTQNADDAGATEVKFLIDWRQHPVKKLLTEEMKQTQGPALLAYNDALFTEKDFENINKLAGATKKEDLEKIGRFGLGFNSVYHFTDTPSFISSRYAVMFDPTTNHLGHFIKNPSNPGIKIDLAEMQNVIRCYPDQFQPYQGVFDCDMSKETPFYYDGTLFRFPFRRSPSEICEKQYRKEDVAHLLHSFERSACNLLLNTQNVENVSVWVLEQNASDATEMKHLMEVQRNVMLYDSGGLSNTTFLQDCAKWATNTNDSDSPRRIQIISTTENISKLEHEQTQFWLQCDLMGDQESLEIATSREGRNKGLLSCAGVSVNLQRAPKSGKKWSVAATDGEAFCFLPLSIPTGLPVHVNGYFAVTSNRRGIWEQTSEETLSFQPLEVRWNNALMKDGISKAYLEVLKEMQQMARKGSLTEYDCFSLWPNPERLQSQAWKPLVAGVYSLIASSSLPLLKSGDKWYPLSHCTFPDEDLTRIPDSLQILQDLGYITVNLPKFARRGFELRQIKIKNIKERKFLEEVFFPNIKGLCHDLRNKVVCYLIDGCLTERNPSRKKLFKHLLSTNACIPCSSNQDLLELPRNLIHPEGEAASLYSSHENKMPVGDCFLDKKRLLVLEKDLGMVKDNLNWDQILDRAMSVKRLPYDNGVKRVLSLVGYLNNHMSEMPQVNTGTTKCLTSLEIFPIMARPQTWFCPWNGDRKISKVMLSATELFDKDFVNIVGSTRPILDESCVTGCGCMSSQVKSLLQISNHKPEVEEAINQLLVLSEYFERIDGSVSPHDVHAMCSDIYKFLQSNIGESEELELMKSNLEDSPWIFVEDRFVKCNQLAFEWISNGEPYLYQVPRALVPYSKLLVDMGVKRSFNKRDIISALNKMKADKQGNMLTDAEFKVSKELLDELSGRLTENSFEESVCTPIPDHNRILRYAEELVINDAPWVRVHDDVTYIHKDISIDLAYRLGAKDVRSKSLEDISRSIGQPFGQKELLTDRLAGILKTYPCDFGILKELLQNADDAKATEIHFIYDPRQHIGERLFKDTWKELQGPALCVYNDRPFSEQDLEGIQRLGIGSKADSPEKTGQYGIGFNAVYHLTDCPSFITNGDTLCILDPHARYAPGATKQNPGRLIGPLTLEHRESYCDVFPGYLGDIFSLSKATMFRFPLRNKEMAAKSVISSNEILSKIKSLLFSFRDEAKEALLFLNYVKKISISTIEEGQLKYMYEVTANLTEEDDGKRELLSAHAKNSKHLSTNEIEKVEVSYPMMLNDILSEEKWLVCRMIGTDGDEEDVPNGQPNGLLPRAGVAAKVLSKTHIPSLATTSTHPWKPKAFCFLPLPVTTGLPLHVNGHFALDSGRRHLWQDENDDAFKTRWNKFIKTKVIAEAYTNLLCEAQKHIPNLKMAGGAYFCKTYEANLGLTWYENLIPSMSESETQWSEVAAAVLKRISSTDIDVFPLLHKPNTDDSKQICSWLCPSGSFFISSNLDRELSMILRNLGFNLLSLKHKTFKNFVDAKCHVKEIAPDPVIRFLSTHRSLLEQLPCHLEDSDIKSTANVLLLLNYCMESPKFAQSLDGIPLLLTRDRVLRVFSKQNSIFVSKFHDLVRSTPHNHQFSDTLIVKALSSTSNLLEDLYRQSHPVVLQLTLADLAKFLPFMFQEHEIWSTTKVAVSWNPEEKDLGIKNWLIKLWSFIAKKHKKDPSDSFLKPLWSWPVIPLTSGHLLPIMLSKTAFDLTRTDWWSTNQWEIVRALEELQCPVVDMELMNTRGPSVLDAIKPYLAYPNIATDVVGVLKSMMEMEGDISGRVDSSAAMRLLQFLQEDSATLKANMVNLSVLRKLPFYETIDHRLVKLDGVSRVCKVPPGIPLDESKLWMKATQSIFLQPHQSLDLLHELLGVELKSHAACYIDFILPIFSQLQECTRIIHLSYIKENLLYGNSPEVSRLENALRNLPFIPDVYSGKLHRASHYYDPRNPIFKVMLLKDNFPGEPFGKAHWLDFLCQIGLQTTFSEQQFLHFAREVEHEAETSVTKAVLGKSRVLTDYLLQEESLHQSNFLNTVSEIKFVVAHKVNEKYTSLIKQYLANEEEDVTRLIPFRNSISNKYESLVWSSVALLPDCSLPNNEAVRRGLGILDEPSLPQVQDHVLKLCRKFKSKHVNVENYVSRPLIQVMSSIYSFLQTKINVSGFFRGIPLVLVEEGKVFVRCEQVAFDLRSFEEQPPYLYKVPREFGQFEPLFKHLGAYEKPCPSQYAFILEALWTQTKGEVLHAEEVRHAKNAMRGLFRTLKILNKDDKHNNIELLSTSVQGIKTLYLLDDKDHLKQSNRLHHASRLLLKRIKVEEFKYDLLCDLHESRILSENDDPENVLSFLPQHLKLISLSETFVEELQADSLKQRCEMDLNKSCPFANRVNYLLESDDFMEGVLRILKSQDSSKQIDDELRSKIKSLRSVFNIVCLVSLETVLRNEKDAEAKGSAISKPCFTKEEGHNTYVFLQHGELYNDCSISLELSQAVNKHIDNAVNSSHFSHLEFMILHALITQPAAISSTLDRRGIADYTEGSLRDKQDISSDLGSLIPQQWHYLLVQNLDFIFRKDEIVGYEKESEQGMYVYARIVRETAAPNLGGRSKKTKRDPTTGKKKIPNPFLRRYLIDIGTGVHIEVDALDLYKLKRPEEVENESYENAAMSECQDIVQYNGDNEHDEPTARANKSSSFDPHGIPHTWEKAVKEIDKALAEIMKLPKEQRNKAIRRLYFRWHPDKNPGMEDLATKAIQYIQNEFKRLTEGRGKGEKATKSEWGDFWDDWNQQARRQRASYDNYRRNSPGFSRNFSWSGGGYGFSRRSSPFSQGSNDYNSPDAKMGRIWLIQCRSDLESVKHLFSAKTTDGFYWLICFQCSQVVEKALKGALYGVSGISNTQLESHDIASLAYGLKRLQGAPDVVHSAGKLWRYYEGTRYPHKHVPARPPKEVFTFQEAQEAFEIAKKVLKDLEEFIGVLHL